jgi:hypothetical protein
MANYTFRILRLYNKRGIIQRPVVEKSYMVHSLEACLLHYQHYLDNKSVQPGVSYLLELRDNCQGPLPIRIYRKQLAQARHKKKLGEQNKLEPHHRCRCSICGRRKLSPKGLMIHLKLRHELLTTKDIVIAAYDKNM